LVLELDGGLWVDASTRRALEFLCHSEHSAVERTTDETFVCVVTEAFSSLLFSSLLFSLLACSAQGDGSLSWRAPGAVGETTGSTATDDNSPTPTASPDDQLDELPAFLPFGDGALKIPDELADLSARLRDDVTPYGTSDDTDGYWSKLVPQWVVSPIINNINIGAKGVFNFGQALTRKSLTNPNWIYSPLKLLDNELKLMLLDGNNIETTATLYINRHSFANVAMGLGIGKVGIGTEPNAKLHIKGAHEFGDPAENTEVRIEASAVGMDSSLTFCGQLNSSQPRCADKYYFTYNGGLKDNSASDEPASYLKLESQEQNQPGYDHYHDLTTWFSSGRSSGVVIGSFDPAVERVSALFTVKGSAAAQSLSVSGTIEAQEVVVRDDVGGADFVFDDGYEPMPLDEVERFVQEHRHLPNIPSAATSARRGVSIGEQQTRLLQTVEELTLHVIEQNKKIERLERALGAALTDEEEQTCTPD